MACPPGDKFVARLGTERYPVRISLASSPEWYSGELTADERARIVRQHTAGLSAEKCLLIPRIPGIDDYLDVLGAAVTAAVIDRVPPQQALQNAAERWEEITEARGRGAQRRAYLSHLGIEEP